MARAGDMEDAKHEVALQMASPAFATVLAGVDAEKGGAMTTPPPAAVFEGAKAIKTGQGYPVCEVIGLRTLYDEPSQQTKEATHEIGIYWTHVGDDEMTIQTQVERLVRATRDLLWNALATLIASEPIEVVSEEYAPLMPAADHPFVKASETVIRLRTLAV